MPSHPLSHQSCEKLLNQGDMVYLRYQFVQFTHIPHATCPHIINSKPVLRLELVPALVKRGEHRRRNHARLDTRVLC